jgi:tRNA1Val (adenine37-N6)-methyltransferase
MPDSFFRFKQFTIHQDKCAMKVCTDACLFGAWIVDKVASYQLPVAGCLDIGTGTGLLSLMFAQKNPHTIIDAVEIDEAAAQQAKENFEASPWKERLNIYNTSIQLFNPFTIQQFNNSTNQPINHSKKYDLIISNPPFFANDLKSDDTKRNLALHSVQLSLEELLNEVIKHLNDDGSFALLLPYYRTQQFINLAMQQSFHLAEKVLVKQASAHNFFRSILYFQRNETTAVQKKIIIKNKEGKYTNEFAELLKDYYLYL